MPKLIPKEQKKLLIKLWTNNFSYNEIIKQFLINFNFNINKNTLKARIMQLHKANKISSKRIIKYNIKNLDFNTNIQQNYFILKPNQVEFTKWHTKFDTNKEAKACYKNMIQILEELIK